MPKVFFPREGRVFTDRRADRAAIMAAIPRMTWWTPGTRPTDLEREALTHIMHRLGRPTRQSWNIQVTLSDGRTVSLLGFERREPDDTLVRSYWLDLGDRAVCVVGEAIES